MNQYFNNNNMVGTQYAQPRMAKMSQPLSEELIKELRTTTPQFSLQVSRDELLRASCTHKHPTTGNFELVDDKNSTTHGTKMCTICGKSFNIVDYDLSQVQDITNAMIDILQSIKTWYVDMPENCVSEYFAIMPLIEKVPRLYEIASNNFRTYENNTVSPVTNPYGFNAYNAVFGSGMGLNTGMQQQMTGFNPMMGQQPQMGYGNNNMQQQQMTGFNPFTDQVGYGQQPQMGYGQQPQMGYGNNNMQQQQMMMSGVGSNHSQQNMNNQQQQQQPQQEYKPSNINKNENTTVQNGNVVSTKTFEA